MLVHIPHKGWVWPQIRPSIILHDHLVWQEEITRSFVNITYDLVVDDVGVDEHWLGIFNACCINFIYKILRHPNYIIIDFQVYLVSLPINQPEFRNVFDYVIGVIGKTDYFYPVILLCQLCYILKILRVFCIQPKMPSPKRAPLFWKISVQQFQVCLSPSGSIHN